MQPAATDSGAWTRYWRAGSLHSCGQAFAGNYAGAIARFWQARFAALGAQATILDVGTGNGAIPRLAHDTAQATGQRWRIHGADLADIDPFAGDATATRYAGLVFHPRTPMDRLPFEPGTVDLLTGQYALEYSDTAASVREFARVVAPGGRVAFVLHATGSVVLDATPPQLDDARLLFDSSGLHRHASAMVHLLAAATTPEQRAALARDAAAEQARTALNAAGDAIAERIRTTRVPGLLQTAMQHVGEALHLAGSGDGARAADTLAWSEQVLRDEVQRLQDLRDAALDRAGIGALAACFAEAGFTDVQVDTLHHADAMPMGWTLCARRG